MAYLHLESENAQNSKKYISCLSIPITLTLIRERNCIENYQKTWKVGLEKYYILPNVKEGTTLEFHSHNLVTQYACTCDHNGDRKVVNMGNFWCNGSNTLPKMYQCHRV